MKIIQEAVETVYQLTQEEKIRQQCEAREDYYRRQNDVKRWIQKQDDTIRQLTEQKQQLVEQIQQLIAQNQLLTKQIQQQTETINDLHRKVTELPQH